MKITTASLIFSLFSFLSFGQWTNGGTISEKFGNTSNGLLTTHWKSIGIGEDGAAMTARYRNSIIPGETLGFIGSKNIFDRILNQPGCEGIRIYFGINEFGKQNLVVVGTDDVGNVLADGLIADSLVLVQQSVQTLNI